MSEIERLKKQIASIWGDISVARLSLLIVDFLAATPPDQLRMLTFVSLKNATGKKDVDQELLSAISLLESTTIHLLDTHLLLIDDEDHEFEIEKVDFAAARESGFLPHPETGEPIDDFQKKVFPFFAASEDLLKIKSAKE